MYKRDIMTNQKKIAPVKISKRFLNEHAEEEVEVDSISPLEDRIRKDPVLIELAKKIDNERYDTGNVGELFSIHIDKEYFSINKILELDDISTNFPSFDYVTGVNSTKDLAERITIDEENKVIDFDGLEFVQVKARNYGRFTNNPKTIFEDSLNNGNIFIKTIIRLKNRYSKTNIKYEKDYKINLDSLKIRLIANLHDDVHVSKGSSRKNFTFQRRNYFPTFGQIFIKDFDPNNIGTDRKKTDFYTGLLNYYNGIEAIYKRKEKIPGSEKEYRVKKTIFDFITKLKDRIKIDFESNEESILNMSILEYKNKILNSFTKLTGELENSNNSWFPIISTKLVRGREPVEFIPTADSNPITTAGSNPITNYDDLVKSYKELLDDAFIKNFNIDNEISDKEYVNSRFIISIFMWNLDNDDKKREFLFTKKLNLISLLPKTVKGKRGTSSNSNPNSPAFKDKNFYDNYQKLDPKKSYSQGLGIFNIERNFKGIVKSSIRSFYKSLKEYEDYSSADSDYNGNINYSDISKLLIQKIEVLPVNVLKRINDKIQLNESIQIKALRENTALPESSLAARIRKDEDIRDMVLKISHSNLFNRGIINEYIAMQIDKISNGSTSFNLNKIQKLFPLFDYVVGVSSTDEIFNRITIDEENKVIDFGGLEFVQVKSSSYAIYNSKFQTASRSSSFLKDIDKPSAFKKLILSKKLKKDINDISDSEVKSYKINTTSLNVKIYFLFYLDKRNEEIINYFKNNPLEGFDRVILDNIKFELRKQFYDYYNIKIKDIFKDEPGETDGIITLIKNYYEYSKNSKSDDVVILKDQLDFYLNSDNENVELKDAIEFDLFNQEGSLGGFPIVRFKYYGPNQAIRAKYRAITAKYQTNLHKAIYRKIAKDLDYKDFKALSQAKIRLHLDVFDLDENNKNNYLGNILADGKTRGSPEKIVYPALNKHSRDINTSPGDAVRITTYFDVTKTKEDAYRNISFYLNRASEYVVKLINNETDEHAIDKISDEDREEAKEEAINNFVDEIVKLINKLPDGEKQEVINFIQTKISEDEETQTIEPESQLQNEIFKLIMSKYSNEKKQKLLEFLNEAKKKRRRSKCTPARRRIASGGKAGSYADPRTGGKQAYAALKKAKPPGSKGGWTKKKCICCHKCPNDRSAPNGFVCTNPSHLYWGTKADNTYDQNRGNGWAARNRKKNEGDPKGEKAFSHEIMVSEDKIRDAIKKILLEDAQSESWFGNSFVAFKKEVSKGKDPLKVAKKNLNEIGRGSTRVVFDLPDNDGFVLKIINTEAPLTNQAFIGPDGNVLPNVSPEGDFRTRHGFFRSHMRQSNEWEADLIMQQKFPDVFPKTFEKADDFSWILVEKALPIATLDELIDILGVTNTFSSFARNKKVQFIAMIKEATEYFKNPDHRLRSVNESYDSTITGFNFDDKTNKETFSTDLFDVLPTQNNHEDPSDTIRVANDEPYTPVEDPHDKRVKELISNAHNRKILGAMADLGIPPREFLPKNLGISSLTGKLLIIDASLWEEKKKVR